jgi:hypothetical protein
MEIAATPLQVPPAGAVGDHASQQKWRSFAL